MSSHLRPRSSLPAMSSAPLQSFPSDTSGMTSVQVAVRVRPTNTHDEQSIPPRWQKVVVGPSSTSSIQVEASSGPPPSGDASGPASLGAATRRQAFTFDRVLGQEDGQEQVYQVVQPLVSRFIDGFNVTVLAYGQTSSGKSYTMGTSIADVDFESLVAGRRPDPSIGIIPRAVSDIFKQIQQMQSKNSGSRFTAKASFIEIYNEELIDLLADGEGDARPLVQIREDRPGHIIWSGLREPKVQNVTDVMNYLLQGSSIRRTNETDMNAQSSRSHAIFSLTLVQQRYVGAGAPPPPSAAFNSTALGGRTTPSGRSTPTGRMSMSGLPRPQSMLPQRTQSPAAASGPRLSGRPSSVVSPRSGTPSFGSNSVSDTSADGNWVTITSKFHFVDLAGSERLKRTAASGDRAKEGISINAGLHALGNVISALGDPAKAKRTTHIPYRDSKLTRLLQDSLGGNAHTMMIACVAPTEYNVGETVNTLQYANRARNIKNKAERNEIEIGWDDIEHLQTTVLKLRKELTALRGGSAASSKTLDDKEVLLWQGRYTEVTQKCSQLTAELTKLQQATKGRSVNGDENSAFLAAAEPIIVEYEKTLDALEGRLNLMKAALSHSEDLINEHETRIAEQDERILSAEQQLESRESTIVDLQARLSKLQDRESTSEGYTHDLEVRLQALSSKDGSDAAITAELKKEVAQLKEGSANREIYIRELEERLSKTDDSINALTEQVERLERDLERRDAAYKELEQRLESLNKEDQTKALLEDYQRSEQSNLELRSELDLLKAEKDAAVKERGRLHDAAAEYELHRGQLEDRIRELEAAETASLAAVAAATRSTETDSVPVNGANGHEGSKAEAVEALELLRRELQVALAKESMAKADLDKLNIKHQEVLTDMHALEEQLAEAKRRGTPSNGVLSMEKSEDQSDDDLEQVTNSDRPKVARRSSFQYDPARPADRSTTATEGSHSRRNSGSFLVYAPRQGGLETPKSKRARPRSLSQSLSQELSQGLLRSGGPRPLSLSAGPSGTVPSSPTQATANQSPLTPSPGGRSLDQRLPASSDRQVHTLQKGVLALQEALRKREKAISDLEDQLRDANDQLLALQNSANTSTAPEDRPGAASEVAAESTNHVESLDSRPSISSFRSKTSGISSHNDIYTEQQLRSLSADQLIAKILEQQQRALNSSAAPTVVVDGPQAEFASRELEEIRQELAKTKLSLALQTEAFEKDLATARSSVQTGPPTPSKISAPATESIQIERDHAEALASLMDEHQTMMEMTQTEHEEKIARLSAEHQQALKEREALHSSKLLEMSQAYDANIAIHLSEKQALIEKISRDHTADMTALREQHARQLSIRAVEQESALRSLQTSHGESLSKLTAEHESRMTQVHQDHEAALVSARASAAAAAASSSSEEQKEALATLEENHKLALEMMQARADSDRQQALSDAHNAHQNERRRIQEEHDEALLTVRKKHQTDLENLSKRLSAFKDLDGDIVDVDALRVELSETSDALVTLEDALTAVTAERDELSSQVQRLMSSRTGSGAPSNEAEEMMQLRKDFEMQMTTSVNLRMELQRSRQETQALQEERNQLLKRLRESAISSSGHSATSRQGSNAGDGFGPMAVPLSPGGYTTPGQRSSRPPPPTPPPNMPPPPTPAVTAGMTRSSVGGRASLVSLMSRAESPGPSSSPISGAGPGSSGTQLLRSASSASMQTTASLGGMGSTEAKKLLAEQGEELKNLAKQLSHCEADLAANIELVQTLESALNDSERNLRKSRVQLQESSRERDQASHQLSEVKKQLTASQREVEEVRNSVLVEKQTLEQRLRQERAAKEKAARDLEARLEELNRKKASKLFCM